MRKNRLKGTSDFFFLESSLHPSGASLDSLASGSTKKNSFSVICKEEKRGEEVGLEKKRQPCFLA